ncbi:MAG: type II toxin-antitoxin system RelE/ParE family toxin [Gammaproteobacteria bacterium]|nr:type II toxin-antitoxin system RelE/ParE family toxin [Gammaproteobacteria bacterium]MCY4211187.1 type II toxin-antitoxin system RelE/ParE family toxin [Gammaproteobacteria bacterium]MCY4282131.1 type II toxin-antitoxin system RelE/ParE family toxin [Gammaproteobacteria bacterium]
MKVVWTHRARHRLQQILAYIAEDQPINAKRWVEKLIDRGDSLQDLPERGRMVPEYHDPEIREIPEGAYRIIYRLGSKRVDILTVRHSSQLLPAEIHRL